jgi:beta-glucanase (GH16 family)
MSDFTEIFRDDFNGNSIDRSVWRTLYEGQYGNGMFRWDHDQLEVADGKLTIATERDGNGWVSGGLSTIPDGITHGSVEFRARFDAGQGTSSALLLWPSNNQWTDEIDIIETNRPQRDGFAFTNHGDPNTTLDIGGDMTGWHTYRLDWTPGSLNLFVDGQEKGQITVDVPVQQMSLGMQGHVHGANETWFGGAPNGSTPDRVETEVDWVRVSAWTPGDGTDASAPATAQLPVQDVTQFLSEGDGAGTDWLAAAQRYVENDGTWEGSWRNQVGSGQITLDDVAGRLQSGFGNPDFWQ